MNEKNIKESKGWFRAGFITVILAGMVPFIIMGISSTGFNVKDIGLLGPVGDFYGGSTIGLLSIASIFFIIHTIQIQSKELSLQREELSLTRKELEKTREEHKLSNINMNRQLFDNTFFSLLNNYNKIIDSIKIKNYNINEGVNRTYIGREAVRFLKYLLMNKISNSLTDKDNLELVLNEKVDGIIKEFGYAFDHYFKCIYSIINTLHINEQLSERDKEIYLNIFLSLMGSDEKYLLYCFGHAEYGKEIRNLLLNYDPELMSLVEFDEVKEIYRIMEQQHKFYQSTEDAEIRS